VEQEETMNATEREELKALIDSRSVSEVLDAIASICHQKSEEAGRSPNRDPAAARLWRITVGPIQRAARKAYQMVG
jgi:hypothetical protein